MPQGDKILKTRIDEIKNAVNAARSRWGLAQDTPTAIIGNTSKATDINNIATKLTEAKNKSGWTGDITTVTQGSIVTDITGNLITQASAIQNHCICHVNCSGSCKNTCSADCKDSCTRSCKSGRCSNGTCTTSRYCPDSTR